MCLSSAVTAKPPTMQCGAALPTASPSLQKAMARPPSSQGVFAMMRPSGRTQMSCTPIAMNFRSLPPHVFPNQKVRWFSGTGRASPA